MLSSKSKELPQLVMIQFLWQKVQDWHFYLFGPPPCEDLNIQKTYL